MADADSPYTDAPPGLWRDFVLAEPARTAKAILRDGRVSLCWDDERPPFHFVTIAGRATTTTEPGELLRWSIRIAGRSMGPELAEQYGRRNAVPPEMLVRVTPSKIVARVDIAD